MMTKELTTEAADKIFARAQVIANDVDLRQQSGEETPAESILRLSYRIARLEHADARDEYTKD